MHVWIANTCEFLLVKWQAATLADYGLLVAVITLSGWMLTRRQTG